MKFKPFILGTLLFFFHCNLINVSAEEPINKPVAIFYSPHQDDELLTMGHAITLYVHNGYEVHVVLLTDGSATNAIHSVNKEVVKHYLSPMSTKEFSDARNLEFIRSLSALGVERKNMHFSRLKDGKTTVNQVEETVLKYKTRFPEAIHMALSYHDDHNDHRNSGLALNNLFKNGLLKEPKFYIQNNERNIVKGVYETYSSILDQPIVNATIPYKEWNPLRRMYSIGIISVPYDFNLLERDPRSKYHLIDQ
ncbi:PIG-L deacetylase family protein [Bacillus sp. KH172YL63]|uniref:PIG-L deacetylase family protein n=1 Tax=Bacillus sp. KH172YL63 TaxID=2709784 RepID=UPI0013E520EB|nr:PIG-L family deacetylase [Bacillus sp. KH172YL63]BCB05775.1 PIG-L family deacetylase [Bacillus sp. KH172YL63]